MMDRRGVLGAFCTAAVASTGWLNLEGWPHFFFGTAQNNQSAKGSQSMSNFDEQLEAEMKMLGTRVYSEEGIAMILACEDLTVEKRTGSPAGAMNAVLVTAFRRYVDAWQRLKPDAPAGDVPKLIELLAYKDLASGGSDDNL